MNNNDLIQRVKEAHELAIKKGIEANTILINRGSNAFRYVHQMNIDSTTIPPMILGLDCYISDELPSKYGFALLQTQKADLNKERIRQELIDELKQLNLDELVRTVYGINLHEQME